MRFKTWLRGPGPDGQPQVEIQLQQDYSPWSPPGPSPDAPSILDRIYEDVVERGETQGIERYGPGRYRVSNFMYPHRD